MTVAAGQISGAVTVAGVATGVAALAWLHLQPTGLSPVRNAVSQYGITAYRAGYRVQTLAFAVAGAAVAGGLAALPRVAAFEVAMCAVFAAARAAISWFPMDEPDSPPTATGRQHGLLAIVAFVAVTLAALRFSDRVTGDGLGGGIATASDVLGPLLLAALLAMPLARRAVPDAFGAVERAFYLFMTAWLTAVGMALLLR